MDNINIVSDVVNKHLIMACLGIQNWSRRGVPVLSGQEPEGCFVRGVAAPNIFRRSGAAVIFASPNTLGHSRNARFVAATTQVHS